MYKNKNLILIIYKYKIEIYFYIFPCKNITLLNQKLFLYIRMQKDSFSKPKIIFLHSHAKR